MRDTEQQEKWLDGRRLKRFLEYNENTHRAETEKKMNFLRFCHFQVNFDSSLNKGMNG